MLATPQLDQVVPVAKFSLAGTKRVDVSCSIEEYWRVITSDSAKCGSSWEYELERETGFEKSSLDILEAAVTSKVGLAGLADLSSEIGEKAEMAVSFSEKYRERRKYLCPSEACDEVLIEVLQKVRRYTFMITQHGWFKTKRRRIEVPEYTNQYYADHRRIENHPDCGCGRATKKANRSLLAHVGSQSCWLALSLADSSERQVIPELGVRLMKDLAPNKFYLVHLDCKLIPAPILFLSGERDAMRLPIVVVLKSIDEVLEQREPPVEIGVEPVSDKESRPLGILEISEARGANLRQPKPKETSGMQDYVESLRSKYDLLAAHIDSEMHRPLPDQAALTRLKRERLRIKDEIAAWRLAADRAFRTRSATFTRPWRSEAPARTPTAITSAP